MLGAPWNRAGKMAVGGWSALRSPCMLVWPSLAFPCLGDGCRRGLAQRTVTEGRYCTVRVQVSVLVGQMGCELVDWTGLTATKGGGRCLIGWIEQESIGERQAGRDVGVRFRLQEVWKGASMLALPVSQ